LGGGGGEKRNTKSVPVISKTNLIDCSGSFHAGTGKEWVVIEAVI
jgi:hypothetical protein